MSSDKSPVKLEILRKLALIRLVEQTIAKHYPEQKMRCPVHLCLGQETTGAVFGVLAKKKDLFFGNYRSHGHYLGKGGDLSKMFLELLGSFEGCSGGMGGSMHLMDQSCGFIGSSAIVSATVPQAAGAALGFKLRNEPYGVVVFFGDAAMEEGVVYETVNFSLLHQLPVLFVCENNRLATNTPIELRTNVTQLYDRFASMGLHSVKACGSSIQEMMTAAETAFEWIRSGKGPFLVECQLTRWVGHVGPVYQGPTEHWWQNPGVPANPPCLIADVVVDLIKEKVITAEDARQLYKDVLKEVEKTFQEASMKTAGEIPDLEEVTYASPLASSLPQNGNFGSAIRVEHYQPSKLENPF